MYGILEWRVPHPPRLRNAEPRLPTPWTQRSRVGLNSDAPLALRAGVGSVLTKITGMQRTQQIQMTDAGVEKCFRRPCARLKT